MEYVTTGSTSAYILRNSNRHNRLSICITHISHPTIGKTKFRANKDTLLMLNFIHSFVHYVHGGRT